MQNYIIGHVNPDTDSIVSAIAMAYLEKTKGIDCVAARAGELNKETAYVLKRFGFEIPDLIPEGEKKVSLVDHNEVSQISDKVDASEIRYIVDHHKLGGLSTAEPISVTIMPVGSTSTILALEFEKSGIELDAKIAGILLAGVISDTLNLTSPTTTGVDKEIVEKLNAIAQVDINQLATEMFDAKSDISDVSTEALLEQDYKTFDIAGKKIGFGVWETTSPASVLERKDEIIRVLNDKKTAEGLDLIFFCAVDVYKGDSNMFVVADEEQAIVNAVFGAETTDNLAFLPGIVSRKKQMIPPLEKYFA